MLDPSKRSGFSSADAKFLEIIDTFGWHVMSVAPKVDSDDKQEWFSYSTGLFMRFDVPEIILCGLDSNTATSIINEIGDAIKSGLKFDLDKEHSDVFGGDVKCRFRLMHASRYDEYVCRARWFYEGDNFPVWQCFWPDKSGHYPWERNCHPEVKELQPSLFEPLQQVM